MRGMLPMYEQQAQWREAGRIRLGLQVPSKNGRRRPEKLKTFRLTSDRKELLEQAAREYGGRVEAWPEAPEGDQWQVIVEQVAIDVLVPPGQVVSQAMERWAQGGCQVRCTGTTKLFPVKGEACTCPADPEERNELASRNPPEACKPHTRVNVFLAKIGDIAVWRVESTGYYAAVEFAPMAIALANQATYLGRPVRARLRIGQRRVKRPGQPPKDFVVPELISAETSESVFLPELAAPAERPEAPRLTAGGTPVMPPAPDLPTDARFSELDDLDLPETAEADADGVVDEDHGLTLQQFKDRIVDVVGVTREEVAAALQARGKTLSQLDDAERGALYDELHAKHAA